MVHVERLQVALVHPDHPSLGPQGPVQLALVVHFDEGGQRERLGQCGEPPQLVVVQRRHNEEHGVRAHEPGIGHVGLAHGEVLAQDREPRGSGVRPRGRPELPPK